MQYTQLSRRSAGGKIDWEKQYLTFIPVEDAVFSWAERATSGHLEYSLNGGQTWVTIADGESTPTVTAGSKVIWRGNLRPTYATSDIANTAGIGTFSASGNYHAYGNTMSLLFYDNYYGSRLNSNYRAAFGALFYNDDHILTAPLLPATSLSSYCYIFMFYSCDNLTTVQERLPAKSLQSRCYSNMYNRCISLTRAPELPALSLPTYAYLQMFNYCTSLNYVKCLAIENTGIAPCQNWLVGVSSTGTFVKSPEREWPTGENGGVPSGWTVIDDNS